MNTFLVSDLHITDKPEDEYRWGLFDWLEKEGKRFQVETIIILGDLTNEFDKHGSLLVNRLTSVIRRLSKQFHVVILRGNHDYVDEKHPFFKFLGYLDNVTYVNDHRVLSIGELGECLFLPCTRDVARSWANLDLRGIRYIFTHQTYTGCVVENGSTLQGADPAIFKDFKGTVYSGDIHVPQMVGKNIEYVGAPYRIKFGDKFKGRIIWLFDDEGQPMDLHYPTIKRATVTVRSLRYLNHVLGKYKEGDQVKVRFKLNSKHFADWSDIRNQVTHIVSDQHGLLLHGIEPVVARARTIQTDKQEATLPESRISDYARAHGLGPALGLGLWGQATGSAPRKGAEGRVGVAKGPKARPRTP